MKKAMKKLMAALLAVAMVCAMAIPAFAAEGGTTAGTGSHNSSSTNGKIIIKNAVANKTYKIYRILDLQYNATTKSYHYVKNTKWGDFVDSKTSYLAFNSSTGDVTWVEHADVQTFANDAGVWASTNSIDAEAEKKAQGEDKGIIEFAGLPLGWYLVVSDLNNGSICSIDSTATEVIIEEKNSLPTVTKLVKEGNTYGYYNDANIGDTVEFNTRITVNDGKPTNYVLHDTMGSGFEFDNTSVIVYRWRYGHEETLEAGTHYDLITNNTDGCTFEIQFKNTALAPSDLLSITYKATVKASATIGTEGNPNTTHLTYNGENTPNSTTKTYVWVMGVHKYTTTSESADHALENAEFQLYKTNADASVSYAVLDKTTTGNATDATEYKFVKWGNQSEATTVVTPASGNINLIGLDAGTYYLEETKAPTGYNKLTDPITVVIDRGTLPTVVGSTVSCTVKYNGTEATDNKTVRVFNNAGTTLPSTGGIGTTIFYVVGGGLMVAAAILLITKKRMENR